MTNSASNNSTQEATLSANQWCQLRSELDNLCLFLDQLNSITNRIPVFTEYMKAHPTKEVGDHLVCAQCEPSDSSWPCEPIRSLAQCLDIHVLPTNKSPRYLTERILDGFIWNEETGRKVVFGQDRPDPVLPWDKHGWNLPHPDQYITVKE